MELNLKRDEGCSGENPYRFGIEVKRGSVHKIRDSGPTMSEHEEVGSGSTRHPHYQPESEILVMAPNGPKKPKFLLGKLGEVSKKKETVIGIVLGEGTKDSHTSKPKRCRSKNKYKKG